MVRPTFYARLGKSKDNNFTINSIELGRILQNIRWAQLEFFIMDCRYHIICGDYEISDGVGIMKYLMGAN